MKRMMIFGSIIAVFLIMLVPATNAVQIQTMERELSSSLISYEQFKNMDAKELVAFIQSIAEDYPQLSEEFRHTIEEIENTPISSTVTKHQSNFLVDKNQVPQPKDDNQTFLEKIFWKIFNYRLFRVYISAVLFIYFHSKFTLMRTMTWSIRLLRWVKIGILLGYIDPTQQPTQTPNIVFEQDLLNKTLTVFSIDTTGVLWSDIAEIGAGECDSFPVGNVTVGDTLTNCTGIIVLQYLPTYEILGVFEFD